ncbi:MULTISPECIES: T9SS type A sorting domain-containing protein [Mesonia]|uniref:Uncharacterized protein n=1 Tax=Mesonia oceanica TaxID=2687242 RepID=A0AC61YA43_9FLAO|nr:MULTISPECIES: T9SS type A sorting domain-containing protein [Mesonia]MAN26705.1 hypothetical protein [Mesonia sp.]MAQ39823.1 hypothetical protein [Mesonia sp.]MBJ96681.1 hypothetical protein [Flavobacteriaceae bacterium]VVV01379.1 hypothetical protein FVB9532_02669 [Mesonia oceanica]|tara:strand:+ start:6709 stop:7968 length:1260 start_codon:yes stop_codon:yes gene_type:complete
MKPKLFLVALLTSIFNINAQTQVDLSMGAGYENEVFYDFSSNNSQTFTASDWEIAFLRTSATNMAIRINDGIGIQVFEASNSENDWETIDVANEANWTPLYNSDQDWFVGAFDNASETSSPFGYGWGVYDMASHTVQGTIIFVLKYDENTYRKLFIEEYLGGYTFKYATWDNSTSTWSEDTTETVSNSNNPDRIFNYYNFTTGSEVIAEPASTDWDLKFTQFTTDYPYNGGTMKYVVTGVLNHPNTIIAKSVESGNGNPNNQNYLSEINTIGYDWKEYDYQASTYNVDDEKYYYVKDTINNEVFRLHFTSFEGSSTGNLSFNAEDVTSQLSTTNFDNGDSFGFYPNPAQDQIEILYKNQTSANVNVAIYTITGQKVLEKRLQNNGFYTEKLDVSQLSQGNYLIRFQSGNQITTKKLILN